MQRLTTLQPQVVRGAYNYRLYAGYTTTGCARGIEVPGPLPILKFFKKAFSFFTKRGPRPNTLC